MNELLSLIEMGWHALCMLAALILALALAVYWLMRPHTKKDEEAPLA